ncbi:cytochrome C biogenesis protein [Blastococcus sp. MG754426]|uniref:cytochrome c biogenesis CcdA family protein n=1 Tax=unclassified Blastococcus TaxID=2619396 RepID=UPI000DE94A5E|nr:MULTISPECIES: cytochrome c biogenesis protein CcdA [unclassified Blastococcus]MCF6507805.1 cytochrome C biogenesis protein [Blastococcus sp. MG754426]MCF6510188.1 cytochrome C biogenesis protein [Blastococcus sp. MG754427]MCF6736153.1 cytochrome C biogenesis protein [Blastococcus sp. KM273129]RBY92481.1 cytochrome C biogenesis protein [Blastococcus sp. TF02-8]
MDLLPLAFLSLIAGVVSFTSPCALPLLPGYVSYVSSLAPPAGVPAAATGGAPPAPVRDRVLAGSLLFVLGFTIVFTALGATASGLALLLAQHRATINVVGGAFIIAMGLATAGVLRLPLLHRQVRMDLSRIGRGPGSALALGAAFAFGWTPCVGPVLAAILTTAAGSGTVARGALLLLVYSIGLGIPFLLVALGVRRGRLRLDWLRRNSRKIEVFGGVLLVAMGIGIATGSWTRLMSGLLAFYARFGWPPI